MFCTFIGYTKVRAQTGGAICALTLVAGVRFELTTFWL